MSVLEAGRAAAEALMVDTCRVTSPSGGEREWDDETGEWTYPAAATVYEGRCKVQVANLQPREAEAGEVTVGVSAYALHLPMVVTTVGRGMTATILTSENDPALVGVKLHIEAPFVGSFKTARRFSCEVVS